MPALSDHHPSSRTWVTRPVIALITLVLLATAGMGTAAAAPGANKSPQIAATRRSQLAYEASMIAADRQLSSLKRERRQTRSKIRKTERSLARIKARRGELRKRVTISQSRLEEASASVEAQAAPGDDQQFVARSSPYPAPFGLPPVAPLVEVMTRPVDGVFDPVSYAPTTAIAAVVAIVATPGEMKQLERQVRKQQRTLRMVQRKTLRLRRAKRLGGSRLRAIKRQRSAALARRAGSEAGLKSRILSMSRLAAQRATKKTKARPGRSVRFIWPTRGRITQGYGCTGSRYSPARGSCRGFHSGIDIAAGMGTAIRASGVGVVSYVGRNPWDRGKRAFMVVVAHPGGYETLYAHVLPIRRVKVGQLVRKGDAIAFMGSTGRSTGPHLHFALRRGGTTLNPVSFL